MAGTPHRIANGEAAWTSKTKTAAETERDEHLNRLFDDLNWEPIVIPFPRGVMIGFVNWAGNWESFTYWHHHTPEQRRGRGCTIDSERDRQKVLISLHRHVAALVRDTEGSEAGLAYLLPEDHDGKEDYRQMDVWQAACKAAKAEGKGDVEAREVADMARAAFANRPEREPVRSLESALALLETDNPVPVARHVWEQCRDTALLRYSGAFFLFQRGGQFQCNNACAMKNQAWISNTLLAGYMNQSKQYCLLRLQSDDQVLPLSELPLTASDLTKE